MSKAATPVNTVQDYCEAVFRFLKDGGGAVPSPTPQVAIDSEEVQETIVTYTGLQSDDLSLYVFSFFIFSAGTTAASTQLFDEVKEPFVIQQGAFVKALSKVLPKRMDLQEPEPYPVAFKALADATNALNKEIRSDEKKLIAFYEFMYFFSLGKPLVFHRNDESDRTEIAVEVWRFFFYAPGETATEYTKYIPFAAVDKWLQFVQSDRFDSVSLDLWRMLYRFTKLTNYDSYDPNDSWPLMLDDFVEWCAEQTEAENTEKAKTQD